MLSFTAHASEEETDEESTSETTPESKVVGSCPSCYGDLIEVICTSYVCSKCNKTLVDKHAYTETITPATCTANGTRTSTCACGHTFTTKIPAPGHNYANTGELDACQTCSRCGEKITYHKADYRNVDGKCQNYCTICEYVFFTTTHITETKTTAPTCGTNGLEIITCRVCEEVISETILPATGKHKKDTKTTEPTCTEDGFSIEFCKICNQEFETLKWKKALGHEEKHTITTAPTCASPGLQTTTCTRCNQTLRTTEIQATGEHTPQIQTIAPTCTENGSLITTCTVCKLIISQEVGHNALGHEEKNTITIAPTCASTGLQTTTCTRCNKTLRTTEIQATEEHTPETTTIERTCSTDGVTITTCQVCKKEISRTNIKKALGYCIAETDDGKKETSQRCIYCGKIVVEAIYTSNNLNDFAFNMYKIIAVISISLAIISLASCGWKFLGAIFFGNYASMAGNDMMKAQKQFIFTILAIMFIILLPKIFAAAIAFFKISAWKPS